MKSSGLNCWRFFAVVLVILVLPAGTPDLQAETDGQAETSPGCGKAAPADAPSSIEVGGQSRDFITVVPPDYDPVTPHRLVFAFHGRTTPNTKVQKYFRIEQNSTKPTIFVYPAATVAADGKFSWYERGGSGDRLRDYAFFDALLEEIADSYCVNLDQVFAVGHSLGASFVNSLGCARGSVIRGVGTVAGRVWDPKCTGPAAAMIIHNPHDDLVPVSRGLHARDWAVAQNGLDSTTRKCEPQSLKCQCYGPPDAVNPVVWCPHTQDNNRHGKFYPHLWPQEAGKEIMQFFDSLK